MPILALCRSVDSPIDKPSNASVRPSSAIESAISTAPYLYPLREFLRTCGALVIDSMPPATMMSYSPSLIRSAAWAIASRPDRQTLLTVVAGMAIGMPALTAACREVIWPAPACSTWPMITYSTWSGVIPARSMAPLMANPPRSTADKPASDPSRRPIPVRAPPMITGSPMPASCVVLRCSPETIPTMLLRIDHVGIACRSLEEAIERYSSVFGLAVVSRETNSEQGVREAMLAASDELSYVQLLEPLGDDTPVGRFLARRGEGIHHVGYAVADVVSALEAIGGRGVRLIDRRPRHGSMGASIAFLHPADLGGVLTELVQPRGVHET